MRKPYESPAMSMGAEDALVFDAVAENAVAQHWDILVMDRAARRVEALSPAEQHDGYRSRERWRFQVEGGEVRVRRFFEVEFDDTPGSWETAPEVCGSYEYLAEHEQLERIWQRSQVLVAQRRAAGPGQVAEASR